MVEHNNWKIHCEIQQYMSPAVRKPGAIMPESLVSIFLSHLIAISYLFIIIKEKKFELYWKERKSKPWKYFGFKPYLRHHSIRPSPSQLLAQWLSAKFFIARAYSLRVSSSSQCSRQILSKSPTVGEGRKSYVQTADSLVIKKKRKSSSHPMNEFTNGSEYF